MENNAVDLLCVGIGVCLYRTVRDNFAEARLGSGLARELARVPTPCRLSGPAGRLSEIAGQAARFPL